MEGILVWVILMVMSGQDIRSGYLSGEGLSGLAAISIMNGIRSGWHSWWGLLAFLPGFLFTFISLASREAVGLGDAYLFWALGFGLQPAIVASIAWDSLMIAGICGMGIYLKGRMCHGGVGGVHYSFSSGQRLPLVPLVAIAVGGMEIEGWLTKLGALMSSSSPM